MDEFPQDLKNALKRADVYRRYNHRLDVIELMSRNPDAPLTEEEKQRILNYLSIRMFPFKVIFGN